MTTIYVSTSANAVKVKKAKQMMMKETKAWKISEILKVLADPTRIKMVKGKGKVK